MLGIKVVAVLSLCWVFASCKVLNLHLDGETKLCSTAQKVTTETEVTVIAKGNIPGADCRMTFDTEDSQGKCGICFQFEKYAFFNTTLASLDITSGKISKVIDNTNAFPTMFMCSESSEMALTLTHAKDYVYDPKEPGYVFTLDIYNQCGHRGTAKSVPFADVVEHAKGYHHGEEKESRETATIVTGLVVGLCLASIFLVVLLIAYCYVKNSPNRGTSKSVGMPKVGGKKQMDVGAGQGARKPEVEMVAYKSKEGDRPEGKPLLASGAAAAEGGK